MDKGSGVKSKPSALLHSSRGWSKRLFGLTGGTGRSTAIICRYHIMSTWIYEHSIGFGIFCCSSSSSLSLSMNSYPIHPIVDVQTSTRYAGWLVVAGTGIDCGLPRQTCQTTPLSIDTHSHVHINDSRPFLSCVRPSILFLPFDLCLKTARIPSPRCLDTLDVLRQCSLMVCADGARHEQVSNKVSEATVHLIRHSANPPRMMRLHEN